MWWIEPVAYRPENDYLQANPFARECPLLC